MDERRAVVASQPGVADAALELPATASAVDRVVAGVFAAAALSPSVLMGPVQLLLGGGGLGNFAIDGRVHQPGQNAPRPRGFTSDEEIPDAAWIAPPSMHAALAAAVALVRTMPLSRIVAPAVELAKSRSDGREKLLRLIGRRGGASFNERDIAAELVAAFGRTAGGLLTEDDLAETAVTVEPVQASRVPWYEPVAPLDPHTVVHVVAAGDARGRFVVACYEEARDGIVMDSLDLVMPRLAAPVRRGETRIRPGSVRPTSAPIVMGAKDGSIHVAMGRPGRPTDDGLDAVLEAAMAETWTMPRGVVGVVRSRDGARALSAD